MNSRFWKVVLVAVMMVIISAPLAVSHAADKPVVLRIGANYIVDTINPTMGWRNWPLRELWYDPPIEWTGGPDVEPNLFESWTISEDQLVWIFKVRKGVTFHDGTPCTAKEMAWSLNWILEKKIPTLYMHVANINTVVALDDSTIRITTEKPLANMINQALIYAWIFPPHIWKGLSEEKITERQELDVTIGTGPYKVTDYVRDEYMIMEAFENYWRGKPVIDKIIWQVYPNPDAMLQALMTGEVDLIGIYQAPPATSIKTLKKHKDVEVQLGLGFRVHHLVINSYENGTQPASLMDPAIRLAMAHAVDKQRIVDIVYLGYATPALSVLPPLVGEYVNTGLKDHPFDPAEGNRILDKAGYVDKDGDGIREYSDGSPLVYRLNGLGSGTQTRILEIIAEGFSQIGIKAEVSVMLQDAIQALYPAHDFDLIKRSWFVDPDPDFLLSLFTCHSRCVSDTDCGWNDSGYCDPEYDEMHTMQTKIMNFQERKDLIWKMQEKLFNDMPYIVLFYGQEIIAYNTKKFTIAPGAADMRIRSAITHGKVIPK
jgi:peptide/nickel transport system substrate-binding protein